MSSTCRWLETRARVTNCCRSTNQQAITPTTTTTQTRSRRVMMGMHNSSSRGGAVRKGAENSLNPIPLHRPISSAGPAGSRHVIAVWIYLLWPARSAGAGNRLEAPSRRLGAFPASGWMEDYLGRGGIRSHGFLATPRLCSQGKTGILWRQNVGLHQVSRAQVRRLASK